MQPMASQVCQWPRKVRKSTAQISPSVFDGDADNDNNNIGSDNELSSTANQTSIAQTIASLVHTLKGGVTILFPPHPISRGRVLL